MPHALLGLLAYRVYYGGTKALILIMQTIIETNGNIVRMKKSTSYYPHEASHFFKLAHTSWVEATSWNRHANMNICKAYNENLVKDKHHSLITCIAHKVYS